MSVEVTAYCHCFIGFSAGISSTCNCLS